MRIGKLNETQVVHFDKEYVKEKKWQLVRQCIDQDFPHGTFSFLDLGGGNGLFTDKVLEKYPNAKATILDSSELLLSKNARQNDRKFLICDSVENMESLFQEGQFDIIFMNWALHHFVADSYADTVQNIKSVIRAGSRILKDRGRLSVFENMYDGLFFDNLPSHLIYRLTSCKKLSKLMNLLGANTAGVGVCFQSRKAWSAIFEDVGMKVIYYQDDDPWKVSFSRKLFLHLGNIRAGLFWIEKSC